MLEKIAQIDIQDIVADFQTFNDLMFFDIQTSFEESYDWIYSEQEPKEFIIFLRSLEKQVTDPSDKISVKELIDFFEWSKWDDEEIRHLRRLNSVTNNESNRNRSCTFGKQLNYLKINEKEHTSNQNKPNTLAELGSYRSE